MYQASIKSNTSSVKTGDTLMLECSLGEYSSDYNANYMWAFQALGESWWTTLEGTSKTLIIPDVKLNNSGDYFCEVKIPTLQSKGNATHTVLVDVKGK